MAERVSVDIAALQAASGVVRGLAEGLDGPLAGAVSGGAGAQATLAGSACGPELVGVTAGLAPVTGDLVRALLQLARGMDQAATRFHEVDVAAASAAETAAQTTAGPRAGRPW